MAVIDTPRIASASFGCKSQSFIAGLFGAVLAWNEARLTRNALAKLTNRELEDIGIVRGDIDKIFR